MHQRRSSSLGRRLGGGAVALGAAACFSTVAFAGFVPGGGNPASDCYMGFDVTGVTSQTGRIECIEGDPCDTGACGDNKCTFQFSVCVNQAGVTGCTPPSGGLAKVKTPGPFRSGIPASAHRRGLREPPHARPEAQGEREQIEQSDGPPAGHGAGRHDAAQGSGRVQLRVPSPHCPVRLAERRLPAVTSGGSPASADPVIQAGDPGGRIGHARLGRGQED